MRETGILGRPAVDKVLIEGVDDEIGGHGSRDAPADDAPGMLLWPTLRRATLRRATQAHPDQAATSAKPDGRGAFGFDAWGRRFAASRGHGPARSGRVLFAGLPLAARANPISAMRRCIGQRAAAIPSRPGRRRAFRAPWASAFSRHARRISERSSTPRVARLDGRAGAVIRPA